jgi:hypothetical protein
VAEAQGAKGKERAQRQKRHGLAWGRCWHEERFFC